jgi:phospho-N-acetylmuramoyl-pentapeptide-transferase
MNILTLQDVMALFVPATLSFLVGILLTPFVSELLYRNKMWKKKAGKISLDGTPASTFNTLHETREVGVPRFGGVIVWSSTLITADLLQILWRILPSDFSSVAFISRNQTWVPLAALAAGAFVGFLDDLYEVETSRGLRLRVRLLLVALVALLCGLWFYQKLGVSAISFPFEYGPLELGILFVPFFVLTALFLYAGGVIDGIDGLAGGVFAIIFATYGALALFQHQNNIAGLCAALAGGLLAFLWFNIPPARFYLSETGSMALTLVLTTIAFLTDIRGEGKGLTILPIVALPLVVTVGSNVIQILGKKIFKRKIFRVAPLHHHFEALGWPPYKVTMRYWVVSVIAALIGLSLALVL